MIQSGQVEFFEKGFVLLGCVMVVYAIIKTCVGLQHLLNWCLMNCTC